MVLAGTISGEVMRFGGMIRVLCLSKEGDLTTVTDDLESILTAYHESGHIVLAATLGRRVKRSGVEKFEQVTDFFLESETPNRQSLLVPGVVQPFSALPLSTPGSLLSREEATSAAYRNRSLEENLRQLAAGIAAEQLYREKRGGDIPQIKEEEDSADLMTMRLLIKVAQREEEENVLIACARDQAQIVLSESNVWGIVCAFADLLLEKRVIEWNARIYEGIPVGHKQMLNGLIAKHTDKDQIDKA